MGNRFPLGCFPKLGLIDPLSDSLYGSGIYYHVFLASISLLGVNRDMILLARDTAFFEGDSVHYDAKSGWGL